jgi:hypothetical protein
MLADPDGQEASNGAASGGGSVSNGFHSSQPSPVATTSNGTHKTAFEPVNGSAQNGKEPERSRQPTTYLGHDREEVTRILIQALSDMGYDTAAESVSRDSGFELESSTVAAFRKAVLDGAWARAEELLSGTEPTGAGNSLLLGPGTDRNVMRFWLRQQKFLELLEQRETPRALMVLRNELTPLCQEHQKLHFLSSLLMCQSAEDLKAKADWDGAAGQSRHILLSELSSKSENLLLYTIWGANMACQDVYPPQLCFPSIGLRYYWSRSRRARSAIASTTPLPIHPHYTQIICVIGASSLRKPSSSLTTIPAKYGRFSSLMMAPGWPAVALIDLLSSGTYHPSSPSTN